MIYATYEYKCRRCGGIFDGSSVGISHAFLYLLDAERGIRSAPMAPEMTNAHACVTLVETLEGPDIIHKGKGVGDLIGYREHD